MLELKYHNAPIRENSQRIQKAVWTHLYLEFRLFFTKHNINSTFQCPPWWLLVLQHTVFSGYTQGESKNKFA